MFRLLSLIGLVIPSAQAVTLEEAGGGPGVSQMWSAICSAIPCATNASLPGGRGLVIAISQAVIAFLFPLISVVAICLVIYAGITIIISNGSEDKISEAKKIIMYASAGVVLSLMTTAVISYIVAYMQGIIV